MGPYGPFPPTFPKRSIGAQLAAETTLPHSLAMTVPDALPPGQVSQEIEECHERLPVDDLAVAEAVQKQSSMGWASTHSTGDN